MEARRAIIYTRVSQDTAGLSRSVSDQEAECRAWCEREGLPVAEVLSDNDLGASRWSGVARPEYERLQSILTEGDVFVTWEASRAQRDLAAYVALRDLCAERRVLWAYNGKVFDLSRGDDRFGTGLDALIAEREADQIRERTLRGKRAAAAAGRPAGRMPYGYSKDHATGEWRPDAETAPVVRELARRIIAGETLRSIATDLNRRGIPAPAGQRNSETEWTPIRVRVMFKSASYAGLRTHQGEIVGPGTWDAILEEEDWHRVRAILDDPDRRTGPGGPAKHLLSGIIVCGVCGGRTQHKKSRPGKPGRYACRAYCVARRSDLVDEYVTAVIVGRLGMPDAAGVFVPVDHGGAAAAAAELRDLRARLDSFADAAAAGSVSAASFARIEVRLLEQIADAERRAAVGPAPMVAGVVTAEDVAEAWEALPLDSKREVIRALVEIRLHPASINRRVFNPDDIEIRWKS